MQNPDSFNNERSILKWRKIDDIQLAEFELRQRERIKQLETILDAERDELKKILSARKEAETNPRRELGSIFAPPNFSPRMTWKDKIIRAVQEAEKPILAREIAAVLIGWEPEKLGRMDVDNTISVFLTQLVRAGGLIRTKRKGQKGSLYSLPE
jgi:hypothetical protein